MQFYALAQIHAIIRQADPFHLIFGTVACRVMWMWSDSYGSSGLGLDVTMAEAYGVSRALFLYLVYLPSYVPVSEGSERGVLCVGCACHVCPR